ncbi:Myosin-1 [Bienertia sinuspersici]
MHKAQGVENFYKIFVKSLDCINQWYMPLLKLICAPKLVDVDPINNDNQYITFKITRQGNIPSYFTPIYASSDPSKRQKLRDEIHDFARQNNKPWLLAGDFNETRFGWAQFTLGPWVTRLRHGDVIQKFLKKTSPDGTNKRNPSNLGEREEFEFNENRRFSPTGAQYCPQTRGDFIVPKARVD